MAKFQDLWKRLELNMFGIDRNRLNKAGTISVILTLLIGLIFAPPWTAGVHDDNLFELGPVQRADILGDGDPDNGPDWADIFDANGDPVGLGMFGGVAASFIKDQLSQSGAVDETTFSGAGGSNKNNDPISGSGDTWHWDTGNVPAKDDLSNVYAYSKINPANGNLIIYSGFERLDPSGDSHVDVEFFQDQVDVDEVPPCKDASSDVAPCNFVGTRTVGDVIVSMDFTVGGTIGSMSIREWNGVEYEPVLSLPGEGCNPADTACAFNNGGLIDGGPWQNFDRHGTIITVIERNDFTEFGFDLTALPGDAPCISTFMGKTRSSQSFTAELKDFTPLEAFNVCEASISIGPDDVNEVGTPHTFTVNVNKKVGTSASPAADGTIVDVVLTDANGAISSISSNTCASPGTSAGTCSITFTSNTAGTVTGHASADVVINSLTFHVETDGTGDNSGDAVKRFVDAFITIEPDDVNSIGEDHTFVVTVKQNVGLGAGFVNAPDNTIVTLTLTDSDGAGSIASSDTCAAPGTSAGQCSITFTSNTAGNVTGTASVTLTIDIVIVNRTTDGIGQNSSPVVKQFVSGSIAWFKVDNAGNALGGATFEVCRIANLNTGTGMFEDITPNCTNVQDNVAPDADVDAGEFLLGALRLGRYNVTETVAPAGFAPEPDTITVELTLSSPDATITIAFKNERPILKVTEFGYTNTPTGTPTQGIVSGIATYTVNVKNFGNATADVTVALMISAGAGSLTYVSSTGPPPTSEPNAGDNCPCTTAWMISLAPSAEQTLVVTVEYSNLPDETQVVADLTSAYTLNSLTRTSSGSPATITFTAQSD